MRSTRNINKFSWRELLLCELNLNGENITIKILEKENKYRIINCEEFIGIKCLGRWEEALIDSITVEKTGDVIVESVLKIKDNYEIPENLYYKKNVFHPWVQLNIKLVDGCYVKIACKNTYILDS